MFIFHYKKLNFRKKIQAATTCNDSTNIDRNVVIIDVLRTTIIDISNIYCILGML